MGLILKMIVLLKQIKNVLYVMVDFYLIQKVLVIELKHVLQLIVLFVLCLMIKKYVVYVKVIIILMVIKCVADSEDSKTQNCFMLDVNKKCDSCDYGYYFKKDVCTRNSDIDFLSYESTKIIALVISGFFFLFFN